MAGLYWVNAVIQADKSAAAGVGIRRDDVFVTRFMIETLRYPAIMPSRRIWSWWRSGCTGRSRRCSPPGEECFKTRQLVIASTATPGGMLEVQPAGVFSPTCLGAQRLM